MFFQGRHRSEFAQRRHLGVLKPVMDFAKAFLVGGAHDLGNGQGPALDVAFHHDGEVHIVKEHEFCFTPPVGVQGSVFVNGAGKSFGDVGGQGNLRACFFAVSGKMPTKRGNLGFEQQVDDVLAPTLAPPGSSCR